MSKHSMDRHALLVALVLVPNSYPRNRFFQLFQQPEAREVRRRAALLRSILDDLQEGAELIACKQQGDGFVRLDYQQKGVSARRSSWLSQDEMALVQHVSQRSGAVWPQGKAFDPPMENLPERLKQQLLGLLPLGSPLGCDDHPG